MGASVSNALWLRDEMIAAWEARSCTWDRFCKRHRWNNVPRSLLAMAELSRALCLSHSVSADGRTMECARCSHFSANASSPAKGDGIRQIPRQIRPQKKCTTHAITFCTHAPSSSHYWTVSLPLILPLAVCHAEGRLEGRGSGRAGGAGGEDARGNAETQIKP